MTERLPCPYLGGEVEFRESRESHIRLSHPNLIPDFRHRIAETLADPDEVRFRPAIINELLFVREFDDPPDRPHIVVVVVEDEPRNDVDEPRYWVVTAYRPESAPQMGDVIWLKE